MARIARGTLGQERMTGHGTGEPQNWKEPELNSAIIGYRRNGTPIRLIRGGSEPVAEEESEVDLLEDDQEPEEPEATEADTPPAWVAALEKRLTAATTSEIDRRINQVVRRKPPEQSGSKVDSSMIREARQVVRETIADSGVRMSPEERDLVNRMAPGLVRTLLESDPDPDRAGSQAASDIQATIGKLRKHYQDRTIRALEQRGAVDRSKLTPGRQQQTSGAGQKEAASFSTAASKAQQLAASRGLKSPQQN